MTLQLIVPAEQSLSVMMAAAEALDQSNSGSDEAKSLLRILTPLLKFRACRDNVTVATGAMEVRGGNGYIEEWVNARLVRDAHIGVLSPYGYLLASDAGSAEAAFAREHDKAIFYGSQFIAHSDAGFTSYFDPINGGNSAEDPAALAQFQSKKPCFTDAM